MLVKVKLDVSGWKGLVFKAIDFIGIFNFEWPDKNEVGTIAILELWRDCEKLHWLMPCILGLYIRVFHSCCTKLAEMTSLYSKDLTTAKKKLPPVGLDLMLQIITGLGVQCLTRWAKQAFAYKFKTLGSLYSHALLISTKSSKSKNQVVHEQKFKDPPK